MIENPFVFPVQDINSHPGPLGMTLRDYFAGQALGGLLAHAEEVNSGGWSWRTGSLAGDAYAFADDMLAERP